jgi:hypothetical protein
MTVKMSIKKSPGITLLLLTLLVFAAMGCSTTRNNLAYDPTAGSELKLGKQVTGALIPLSDEREQAKSYPKQVIVQTDYSGNVSYDINDRTVADVLNSAVSTELSMLGVKLIKVEGVEGPLDKKTVEGIRTKLASAYPEAKVGFGGVIKEFIATSKRNLIAHNVHVTAWLQFYVLDIETGDLLWSDYKTEWDDVAGAADHNYMIDQLDLAVVNLMQKSVRDNESMKDLLVKVSNRK